MIRSSTTQKLQEYLWSPQCGAGLRGRLVTFKELVVTKLCDLIAQKYEYLQHIPHKFLGVVAHIYAGEDVSVARRICLESLAVVDGIIADGAAHKLHRVTVFLAVGGSNQVRLELQRFASGGDLGPSARAELMKYAMASLVSRRVEAVHSRVKSHGGKAMNHAPPLINARVRRPELIKQLDCAAFFAFAVGHYRDRSIGKKLLQFTFQPTSRWRIQLLSPKQVRAHIFQFSAEAQTQNVDDALAMGAKVKEAIAVHTKPDVLVISPVQTMIVDFMKDQFAVRDVLWSIPQDFVSRDADAVVPGNQSELAVAIRDAVRVPAPGAAEPEPHRLLFFRVVAARPETKKVALPAHMQFRRTLVRVQHMEVCSQTADFVSVKNGSQNNDVIDLLKICGVGDLTYLRRWAVCYSAAIPKLNNQALEYLHGLDALGPVPRPDSDHAQLQMVAFDNGHPADAQSSMSMASDMFDTLLAHKIDHQLAVVPITSLPTFSMTVAKSLQRCGALDLVEDEFGELCLALAPNQICWQSHVDWQSNGNMLSAEHLSGAKNKLSSLIRLLVSGWDLCADFPAEIAVDSPRHVQEAILSRPLSCLAALVNFNDIVVERHAGKILMAQCDGYYRCLDRLGDQFNEHILAFKVTCASIGVWAAGGGNLFNKALIPNWQTCLQLSSHCECVSNGEPKFDNSAHLRYLPPMAVHFINVNMFIPRRLGRLPCLARLSSYA